MKIRYIILFSLLCAFSIKAQRSQVVNLSLVPDVAIYGKHQRINGFLLNIWGENPQTAFALGLVNGSTGTSAGLSLAAILNYTDVYTGVQIAPVNWSKKEIKGVQLGIANIAKKLSGLQLGVINYAQYSNSGIQVGFINIMSQTKKWFSGFPSALAPFMIIANWRL